MITVKRWVNPKVTSLSPNSCFVVQASDGFLKFKAIDPKVLKKNSLNFLWSKNKLKGLTDDKN